MVGNSTIVSRTIDQNRRTRYGFLSHGIGNDTFDKDILGQCRQTYRQHAG